MSSLYERLGGTEGITAIASDTVDLHLANPRIAPRYADSDLAAVKNAVTTFFVENSGGPSVYDGKSMLAAHRGMNIDDAEFVAPSRGHQKVGLPTEAGARHSPRLRRAEIDTAARISMP